jgi:DNA mismatch repair protein MutL
VDVNVHPTKREIKFLLPGPVYQAVGLAVGNALVEAQKDLVSYAKISGPGDSFVHDISLDQGAVSIPGGKTEIAPYALAREQFGNRPTDRVAQSTLAWGQNFRVDAKKTIPGIKNDSPSAQGVESLIAAGLAKESVDSQLHPQFQVLGQVLGTYIVAQKDNSLVLVDQHAAHERVVYEGLKKRHQGLGVQSQELLVPEVLDLSHGEADCLTSMMESLSDMGLRIEPFGGSTFVIKAVPLLLEEKDLKRLVLELVESFMENRVLNENWQDSCLISMACHSALRANRQMNRQEMVCLLEDLEKCDNPLHCPHGRPTLVSFDALQLKKLFKRVV